MRLVRRRRNRSPGPTSLRDHYERTAVGLLEALSPISGLIAANHDPGTFISRGVRSSTYQLVPAAFRGRRLPFPDHRPVSRRTFHNQIWAEIVYISEYCRVAEFSWSSHSRSLAGLSVDPATPQWSGLYRPPLGGRRGMAARRDFVGARPGRNIWRTDASPRLDA